MYKLSPSDFAYLYEECKCCYYLKIKHGIYRPSSPFPGVFSALNTRLQGTLIGNDLRLLSEILPNGIVESQEGFVESKIIPGTNVYIKGKYDLLVKQPDGTYLIVDFKISQPDEEKISKYQTQLQAYHYAFENPTRGEPKKITKLGLIVMYPDKTKFVDGCAIIDFPPKWLEIEIKKDFFLEFMNGVNDLLEGPPPSENPNCSWCKYRHMGEIFSHDGNIEYVKYMEYQTLSEWWEKEGKGKFPVQICIEISKMQKNDKDLSFQQALKQLIDKKAIILLPKK